jgi:hypothetical protein
MTLNRSLQFVLVCLFIASICLPRTAHADPLKFERFLVEWPPGYRLTADPHPTRYQGPNGEVVLVSVYALYYELSESVAHRRVKEATARGERLLQLAAGRQGNIVVHATTETLPSGLVLLSTATSTPDTDPPGFYVQYQWISPKGETALLTVEGRGSAQQRYEEFLGYARSAVWP